MCALSGVVVVPELQGNLEAEFYAEMYVDDIHVEFGSIIRRVWERVRNDVSGGLAGSLATVGVAPSTKPT